MNNTLSHAHSLQYIEGASRRGTAISIPLLSHTHIAALISNAQTHTHFLSFSLSLTLQYIEGASRRGTAISIPALSRTPRAQFTIGSLTNDPGADLVAQRGSFPGHARLTGSLS